MNKTFKVIFSKTRGALVAVNEAAKTTSRASVKTAVAGVCAALLSVPAMAAGFTDYCKDGNCVVDGQTVEGNGSVVILDSNSASNKVQSITIKNSTISNTPFELRGSQKISVSDTVFTGPESGKSSLFAIFAHKGDQTVDVTDKTPTDVKLNNVTFKNNKVSQGSLFVYDKTTLNMKGGEFVNNETTYIGGGAMIKSGTIIFEDVLFQNNVAKNDGTTLAAGGAVYVDITTSITQGKDKDPAVGEVTFKLTKDMAYTGNRIESRFEGKENTYGWWAYASGGFLFLDRSSKGAFDIADGVTLTIGTASATGEDDSIASALPESAKKPGYSTLVKKGAGTVVMYGSMDKYFGNFTVEAGTFDVRKAWTSLGNTTVTGGVLSASNGITLDTMKAGTNLDFIQSGKMTVSGEGTVTVKSLKLANSAKATSGLPFVRIENGGTLRADTIDVAADADAGTVTLAGGTLETGSAQVYDLATKSVINADASKVSSEKDLTGLALKAGITATSGTLALTDEGYYTTASLKAMSGALKAGTASLSFLNSKLYKAAGETAELVDSVIQSTEQVTASSTVTTNADGKASAQVTVKNSGAQTVVVKDSAQTGAKAVDQVTFAAPENSIAEMTLVGSAAGGHLVQNTAGKAVDVEVAPDLTLNLGQTELPEQTTGTLSNLTLSTGTTDRTKAAGLTVANIVAAVEKLVAAGNNIVTVGNERKRGVLKIGALDLGAGSKVFVDPAWQNDAALNTIGNASHLEIAQVESLRGSLIAGQNSLITIGATAAQAEAAFNQAGLNWGKEAVSAALYLGTSVNPEGGILVNGSLTSVPGAAPEGRTVTLAAGSLLMVDAAAVGEKAVTGTVSAVGGAKVALVNAAEGTFKLADTVTGLTSASFVSDNLFTTTALNGSDVSTTLDKNAFGGAVASMGLQSMIRRADSVLAATVADRTSIDQELGAGANLWVDVGGESYEADGFDNNASFKSDMGYGVFGADVAVSDDITLGAALQYGTGSARSSNFGMKNEIDTWGLTAYSVYKTGDARFVGEVAYVKAKNDISASAASKLSQSVDTEMLSAGMSAHYQFDAGAVTVTPSLGIRLSQLKTDALKVGAIRIADDEMTVFQVPVAVRVGMKPVEASGWNIAPAVKLAYVPTFGDDETDILGYQQKVLDTSPVQADIGVEARKGNFMVNVNFLAGTGSEGAKAVGGKVGVKYLF